MKYIMNCSNGWSEVIEAPTLRSAKIKATKMATHDCGSFSITEPSGIVHSRSIWHGFNAWGWYAWITGERATKSKVRH